MSRSIRHQTIVKTRHALRIEKMREFKGKAETYVTALWSTYLISYSFEFWVSLSNKK